MQLLIPRLLLCLDGNTEVLENHAVLIDGERVAEVGPALTLLAKYPEADKIELPDQVLMPGLINCHTHAAMNLFRGIADDLALHDWLQTRIWPLEGAHADQEFVYDGTVMSAAEMLLGGTTTFNDMYFYPDQVVQAAIDVGIRVVAGITVIEFPTRYASDANQYIELGLAARDKTLNEATVHWSVAPHAPYTVSDDTFLRLASLAEELNLPIHCHLHETASEVTDAVSRNSVRPFDRLLKLGVINERFMAVHGVHLNDSELAQMSKAGASLVHCPASNLKLASGIAPISTALKAGVNVVVGTDGAASNNKIDMWDEMRLAALLCKGASLDATAWTASEVLLGVTNGAAKALGLESVTGRISSGFKADLIAVELDQKPHQSPLHNLVSKLVYSGSARDVAHVWVNGKRVVESQQLVGKSSQLVSQTMRKVTRVWQTRLQ